MRLFYRILLTINSMMMFFVVYLIKSRITVFRTYEFCSYVLYIVVVLSFSWLCLIVSRWLPHDTINGEISEVELADGSYLPSYLAYFFIALSINPIANNDYTVLWVGGIIVVFSFLSQTLYFNPMFLLFRYRFYYVTLKNGLKIFILSKQNIKGLEQLEFKELQRINNYTYIERGIKNEPCFGKNQREK